MAAFACFAFGAVPAHATSCANLQTAINSAPPGGTVTVDQGTCNNISLTLSGKAITLEGAGAGAVFNGGSAGFRIFTGSNAGSTILRNLTFENSSVGGAAAGGAVYFDGTSAPTIDNVQFYGNSSASSNGGALFVNSSSGSGATVVIRNSVFGSTASGNSAVTGGGAHIASFSGTAVQVLNSRFVGNTAVAVGGGADLVTSSLTLQGNTFSQNRVNAPANASAALGGGLFFQAQGFSTDQLTQSDNRFDGNSISGGSPTNFEPGGGGEWIAGLTTTSRNDRFTNNALPAAQGSGNSAEGAGLGIEGCDFSQAQRMVTGRVENLAAAGNTIAGTGSGAGVYVGGCTQGPVHLDVFDSTIAGNQSSGGTAGLFGGSDDELTLTNSIVDVNSGGSDLSGFSTKSATFSDVCLLPLVPFPGGGNVCADPLLAGPGPGSGDVHQTQQSPTIDRGSNALVPAGLTQDYEGDPRIVDGGSGQAIVDMGADEFVRGLGHGGTAGNGGNGGNGGHGPLVTGTGGPGGPAGPCGGGGAGGGAIASGGGGAGGGGCFGVASVQSLASGQISAFAGVAENGTTVRADAFADLGTSTNARSSRTRAKRMQLIGSTLMRKLGRGRYTVVVRLSKKARRAFKRKRLAKVSLRLQMTAPTGPPFILTRSVTLKRRH